MCAYFLRSSQFLLMFFIVGSLSSAFADEDQFTVFEVRKRLSMANDEKPIKDYYISAGIDAGLKPEMIVDVKRRIPIHDTIKNQSRGDLVVTVGKVQIIHVESGLAVARAFSETSPTQRPITGFETVMIGDFLDISSAAFMVPKGKRKAASVEESASSKENKSESTEKKPSVPPLLRPTHASLKPLLEIPQLAVPMVVN